LKINNNMPYKDLKKECYEANMQLPKLGLVLFTFGNASVVDRQKGVFAIKPSGVPYDILTWEDIVIVDFEAMTVEGKKRPSSDTKTHAVLYKNWENIGGIVHTHSTYATAWAQSTLDIPIFGTTHADHLTCDIPCAPAMSEKQIKGNYELETGNQILEHFKAKKLDYKDVEMILLAHHAPFTWGKSVEKAVYNSAVLEEVARMASITLSINPNAKRLPEALIQKHFERKHGGNAYYGQE
jgi:L-ribulose-5-phosphate 4-epimerase